MEKGKRKKEKGERTNFKKSKTGKRQKAKGKRQKAKGKRQKEKGKRKKEKGILCWKVMSFWKLEGQKGVGKSDRKGEGGYQGDCHFRESWRHTAR